MNEKQEKAMKGEIEDFMREYGIDGSTVEQPDGTVDPMVTLDKSTNQYHWADEQAPYRNFLPVQQPVNGVLQGLKEIERTFIRDDDAENPFMEVPNMAAKRTVKKEEKDNTSGVDDFDKAKDYFDKPEEGEEPVRRSIKGKVKLDFKTEELNLDDVIPVASLDEAERMIFEDEIFPMLSMPPIDHIEKEDHLAHTINRACYNISNNNKRGVGNTIVFNPSISEEMKSAMENEMFQHNVECFPTPNCPEDEILVLYRGTEDSDHGIIFVDNKDKSGILLNSTFAPADTYGRVIFKSLIGAPRRRGGRRFSDVVKTEENS